MNDSEFLNRWQEHTGDCPQCRKAMSDFYEIGTGKPGEYRDDAHVHLGKRYARVDVGTSGRYMVDMETEEIFGIKGYGVIHRGHRFGTLDTINDWYWGEYRAMREVAA